MRMKVDGINFLLANYAQLKSNRLTNYIKNKI